MPGFTVPARGFVVRVEGHDHPLAVLAVLVMVRLAVVVLVRRRSIEPASEVVGNQDTA